MKLRNIIWVIVFAALVTLLPGAAQSAERFKDKGDGTVLDTRTNLMWMKDAGLLAAPAQVANSVIEDINTGKRENHKYNDWRIPSVDELASVIDTAYVYPALPEGHPFDNVLPERYWSSTGGFDVMGYAWVVDMATGAKRFEFTSYCNFYRLWPVRSAGTVTVGKFVLEGRAVSPGDVAFLSMQKQGGECRVAVAGGQLNVPSGVTVTVVSPIEMLVSWDKDSSSTSWFNVYDGDTLLESTPSGSLRVKSLKTDTEKCFTVSAYDERGNESLKSPEVCARVWTKMAVGTVWSEGLNSYGQLGDGTRTDSRVLMEALDIEGAVSVAAGVEHVAAVGKDGSIWLWGRNSRGQLGDGTTRGQTVPKLLEGLKGVKQAALGWYHSLVLLEDGTIRAWGRNYYGQLGDGSRADKKAPVATRALKQVVQVASGWYHSMALKEDGTVWAWGWDIKGQLGNGEDKDTMVPQEVGGLSQVKLVAGGMYHSLALGSDGTVWAWGSNEFGQIGQPLSYPESHFPLRVDGSRDIISVEGGMYFSLALDSAGAVWAWGRNDYGQLGRDDITQSSKPMKVPGLENIKSIAAGAHHAVAMDSEGALWMWGWKYAESRKFAPPHKVGGLKGITNAAAGVHFTTVLKGR